MLDERSECLTKLTIPALSSSMVLWSFLASSIGLSMWFLPSLVVVPRVVCFVVVLGFGLLVAFCVRDQKKGHFTVISHDLKINFGQSKRHWGLLTRRVEILRGNENTRWPGRHDRWLWHKTSSPTQTRRKYDVFNSDALFSGEE